VNGQLFVYGTLAPGQQRWPALAPFVVGEGRPATVEGLLYDTGYEYPAARFGGDGTIHGRVFQLTDVQRALDELDVVEGAVELLYERVQVVSSAGAAWAYECVDDRLLGTLIEHGDWLRWCATG
jgi:gamma-glutamylcyclotransferase (GGCT)/AIG2-like uncharacterized protein YtfP